LAQAIEDAAKHPESGYAEARKYFEDQKAWIEGHLDVAGFGANFEPDDGLLGRSHAEQSYREWCLANRLFLNPINDVISRTLAAHDNLSLLDFQTKLSEPPVLIGFFNQLKQEYVTARWGYYCGVHADRAHFSDRYVSLSNTLDYSSYGLAIEQVRTAFRVG
jgi:LA2681-like HEPN